MKLIQHVDPFIGVNEYGNCLCGPYLPHGLVRLSPDTLVPQSTSGYQTKLPLMGFSHTHLNGTGGEGRYGNILVTPFVGLPRLNGDISEREGEQAAVGYYRVVLKPSNVEVELTATARAGVHRYRFPDGAPANLLFDTGAVIQTAGSAPVTSTGGSIGGYVEFTSPNELVGRGDFKGGWGNPFPYSVFFYAKWDATPKQRLVGNHLGLGDGVSVIGPNAKAICHFEPGTEVNLVVGISFVSIAKARASAEGQAIGKSFEAIRHEAEEAWEPLLSSIRIEGGTEEQQKVFNTFLYRLHCMPGDLGIDDEFPFWQSGVRQYNDLLALWDSVRNANSLLSLIDHKLEVGILNCLLDVAEHNGWLPDCWFMGHSAQIQGGSSTDVLFCEAALKGLEGIDYAKALTYMRKNNEVESPDPLLYGRHLKDYRDLGYVSTEVPMGSVSRHLEYAYQDWCIGTLAEKLGQGEAAKQFYASSRKVWNLWRDDLKCFGPKDKQGQWVTPFDPSRHAKFSWFDPYFYEGSSWQWSWNVQHDIAGLVVRYGGAEGFIARLDEFFEKYFRLKETMLNTPYLYLYAGRPDKTAERLRICLKRYRADRDGLPDNEDMGAHSAFYICSMIGLYPAMGQDLYWLTSPMVKRSVMSLSQTGKELVIEAEGGSAEAIYVQRAWLNGQPLERAWVRHEEIVHGGTLRFELGSKPGDWGTKNIPPTPLS